MQIVVFIAVLFPVSAISFAGMLWALHKIGYRVSGGISLGYVDDDDDDDDEDGMAPSRLPQPTVYELN